MADSVAALILYVCLVSQIKRADTAFYWEEREIMANANSEWIVQVCLKYVNPIQNIMYDIYPPPQSSSYSEIKF